jgi:acetyltransferase-like isoleucine patch superfamily enzyme
VVNVQPSAPAAATVPLIKRLLNVVALAIVSPAALTCWFEGLLSRRSQALFAFWAQLFAILPGLPGLFLRRAFYRWTLERCAEEVTVEFGVLFSRRSAILDHGAYIGPYALIGSAWIQENCLIGSRASLLSGGRHHELLPTGQWTSTDYAKLETIVIGANTWIGEGAILMAGTGRGCMVAAGAVVSTAVPPGTMVAGNPARFVRRLAPDADARTDDQEPSLSAVR